MRGQKRYFTEAAKEIGHVPDSGLFGSAKTHKVIRGPLVDYNRLESMIDRFLFSEVWANGQVVKTCVSDI